MANSKPLWRPWLWSLVGCVCLCLLVGCSDQLRTYPVRGKVVFKTGKPVHVGKVELKSREHGVQARGAIGEDGSFSLTTYTDGDGAVAGTHDCVVVQFVMAEDVSGHRPSTVGVVDRKHASYATSGLQVEIDPNAIIDGYVEVTIAVDGVLKTQPDKHTH